MILALAAGAGAVLASAPAVVIVCVLVLAAAAGTVGWLAGEHHREALQKEIGDRSSELSKALSELEIAQAETVRRLSMAVEFRDEDTGAHIERIGRFSTLLAEQVGMEEEFCLRMVHAAPLHDVGKVAIPDAILLKPGKLTAEERAIVETHAEEGHRLLKGSSLGDPRPGRDDRAEPPREVGRQRLPARREGRGDPDRGADRGDRGRVRRADQRPGLPQGVRGRGGREMMRERAGQTLRPGAAGCVPGGARQLGSGRPRARARRSGRGRGQRVGDIRDGA